MKENLNLDKEIPLEMTMHFNLIGFHKYSTSPPPHSNVFSYWLIQYTESSQPNYQLLDSCCEIEMENQ